MKVAELSELKIEWERFTLGRISALAFAPRPATVTEEEVSLTLSRLERLSKKGFSGGIRGRFLDPPEFSNEARKRSWLHSRTVLLACLDDVLSRGADPSRLHLSLSHSVDAAIAVACEALEVGVDLELCSRSISEAVQKRFYFEDEKRLGLSPVEVWTVKEAAFKAHPHRPGMVISDFEIFEPGRVRCFGTNLDWMLAEYQRWTIAFSKSRVEA